MNIHRICRAPCSIPSFLCQAHHSYITAKRLVYTKPTSQSTTQCWMQPYFLHLNIM